MVSNYRETAIKLVYTIFPTVEALFFQSYRYPIYHPCNSRETGIYQFFYSRSAVHLTQPPAELPARQLQRNW
jgi:hypothetical protein